MAKSQKPPYSRKSDNEITSDPSAIIALSENILPLDENWAAKFLVWASGVTPTNWFFAENLALYRGIDLGVCNVNELNNYFDPSPEVPLDKKADLMRKDNRNCPLISSLNNIVQKNIEAIPVELKVTGSDKLSINKKAEQKLKIKTRRATIELMNLIRSATNDMPLPTTANPESVVLGDDAVNEGLSLMESIKQEATDDFDFNALNEAGALKDGVEIAHEQSIAYYFNECKFKENLSFQIISDFMKVSALAYRFYTSAYNGLPRVSYIDLSFLKTSGFKKRNGDDMDYWYFQSVYTWAEYMDMVGAKLSQEQNKRIYERNRNMFYPTAGFPDFPLLNTQSAALNNNYALMQTRINLGYFEAKKNVYDEASGKYYDVIKKFYYLPFAPAGFNEDYTSDNILDFGTLQDQYRHGNNLSLAKFSLVVWRDASRQSFYDVQQGDFLRLNILYNQYINTLANFTPEGTSFAEETITELADQLQQEEEEYMKEMGQSITSQSLARFRSNIIRGFTLTGKGIFKLRKGDNNEINLDKPTFINENKIMQNLDEIVRQMFNVYNSMLMSLGINQTRLAQDPKPRQVASGIEAASQASYFSTAALEDAYLFSLREFGERMLYYDQLVVKEEFNDKGEPTTERAKELFTILGRKGSVSLEVYKDMPYERCVLTIENLPSPQDRLALMAVIQGYELQGVVPPGTLLMAQQIKNLKLANLFVIFTAKKYQRERIEAQQELMAQQQQAQQQAIAAQQQMEAAKLQQEYDLEARNDTINNKQKTDGQIEVKGATLQSRIAENQNKTENSLQEMAAEKQMETY